MTFLLRTLFAIAMWLISACSAWAQSAAPPAAGRWQGAIHVPEHELNLTVDLATSAAGAWIGTVSIPGTTAIDVPLATVAVDDRSLRFTALVPDRAAFEAMLSADAQRFAGTASNEKGSAPFESGRSAASRCR